jgi:hypothetical protein
MATPFLWTNQWAFSMIIALVIFVWQGCRQAQYIDEKDKWEIRFNIMEASEIVHVMADCELAQHNQTIVGSKQQNLAETCLMFSTALAVMAKKYDLERTRQSRTAIPTTATKAAKVSGSTVNLDSLALACQEAVYLGFRQLVGTQSNFGGTADLTEASIALLALVAKNPAVRERHRYQADVYGLDLPVQIIDQALQAAKKVVDDEAHEQAMAEIQRKACLLLGALAEGDPDLAQLLVGEGAIEIILNGLHWYQFHAHVANWGLWALFILCYEYAPNKVVFVEAGGLSKVLRVMKNCAENTEVARHGTALLFDLLRQPDLDTKPVVPPRLDLARIRQEALIAELHPVLIQAMEMHSSCMEIMMMGREILMGTGYEGQIPMVATPEPDASDL